MSETLLVCSKCGATAPSDASGWLNAQRKDQPEGYLIIRCPAHHTDHARRLAGLPQRYAALTGYAAQKKYRAKMKKVEK